MQSWNEVCIRHWRHIPRSTGAAGHNSLVSTHLFEQARDIVLEYLGLNKDQYVDIFCTPRRDVLSTPLADYNVVFTSNTTEAINLVSVSSVNKNG